MRLDVSIRCSIPLSFHALGMAKKHVLKLRAEDFVAVEAALRQNLRCSAVGAPPVGSAPRRCRREIGLDWCRFYSQVWCETCATYTKFT